MIDGEQINRLFVQWLQEKLLEKGYEMKSELEHKITAIDGKTARGSKNDYHKAVHIVSAYCVNNAICLGQIKTEEKSNEITAIPDLLDMLCIEGQIVTIDAMGCQKKIAKKIKQDNEADYILGLKGNQGTFEQEVGGYFADTMLLADTQAIDGSYYIYKEKSHSSIITYKTTVTDDISWFADKNKWVGLNIIGMIQKTTVSIKSGERTEETRFYIGSTQRNAQLLYEATRAHWNIETSLHWHLDVTFREDANQTKDISTVKNMNIVNKMALTLLKIADFGTKRLSIARKRKLLHMNFPKYMKKIIESVCC
jgi:predicted transposase YbfD/YdcC